MSYGEIHAISRRISIGFKDLVYPEAIDRHRNLTYAAQELFITQPALTKFLKSFESSLGVELFRRTGNHMVPTDAGNQYLIFAREVLAALLECRIDAAFSAILYRAETLW